MATTYAFVVILPNARRANVKASTNTTVLEVLEDVCKKHELNPVEFDLTFHNKIIDLGNTIRFSGIPNNATLEMVASTKARTESAINLGLQLESGKRLMHPFHPQQTLWEIVTFWSDKGEIVANGATSGSGVDDVKPVCIYMRQEVIGQDQLERKTLRSLGLTKGSAMIRFIYRSESSLKTQANVSAPLSRPAIVQPMEVDVDQRNLPSSSHPDPKQPSHKVVTPPTLPKSMPKTQPEPMTTTTPTIDDAHAQKNTEQLVHVEEEHTFTFTPPVVNNAARFSKKGELHIIGPHDAILYHGDDVVIDAKDSVDDSFFDLSLNEVKRMYLELQSKRQAMEEAPLQTRSARELERDTTTLRMLRDYPTTLVRIRFPDRHILQASFRTADSMASLHQWLASFLRKPDTPFYLFTAPPKKILPRESTLVEQELVGMAVLYFGCEEDAPSSSSNQTENNTTGKNTVNFLKDEFYTKISAPDAVYEFLHKKLKKEVATPTQSGDDAGTSTSGAVASPPREDRHAPPPQRQPRPTTTSPAPKWFKPT